MSWRSTISEFGGGPLYPILRLEAANFC